MAGTAKKKILIVDDSKAVREGLSLLLAEEFEITSSPSGEEALDILQRSEPDLVLLDLILPGIDGEQFLEQIPRIRPGLRVVVISVSQEPDLARRLLRAGARDYLPKPFGIGLLKKRVRQVLED